MNRIAPVLFGLFLGAACGGTPRVDLAAPWPDRTPGYEGAHERWTRHATDRRGFDLVIEVHATLKSPEWRAAFVAETARRSLLPESERLALEAAERKAADEVWELELVVATRRTDFNDLNRGPKSAWRLALVGDGGREALPLSVKLDRRPRDVIESWFEDFGPFTKAYVVTFPKIAPDGQPLVAEGSGRISLKVGSAMGGVELVWSK